MERFVQTLATGSYEYRSFWSAVRLFVSPPNIEDPYQHRKLQASGTKVVRAEAQI